MISEHDEGVIYTFAFPLPFRLRLPPGLNWIVTDRKWSFVDREKAAFEFPFVSATFIPGEIPFANLLPYGLDQALNSFYRHGEHQSGERDAPFNVSQQTTWVSLETPMDQLKGEPRVATTAAPHADEIQALSRCLTGLNAMLRAYTNSTFDYRATQVLARDIGHLVAMGRRDASREWHATGPLIVNSEHWHVEDDSVPEWGMKMLSGRHWDEQWNHPFLTARTWKARAEYARFRQADMINAVVSLNTAAESLLFDTYRMLCLDSMEESAGADDHVLPDPASELPLAKLLKSELPHLLGGNWSLQQGTPAGRYFRELYALRNSVVHGAKVPNPQETLDGFAAFQSLENFLVERLLARWRSYPRTLMTMAGENLSGHSLALNREFIATKERIVSGRFPYWLPDSERHDSQAQMGPSNWVQYPQ
ncbi:hypothetical protein [Nocardioides sp. P86]|uniref:hypothetical protein n=1 Tax=Nocardioides sp. P86 TaxID=2939569 RepID=UPI00203A7356|nr:hypothetical protein [Nocardioides sp. P86]MCM3515074.1 hypothetical protein [Nocardioides sp. P86]